MPGSGAQPPRTEGSAGNLEMNNPLSLHDEVRGADAFMYGRKKAKRTIGRAESVEGVVYGDGTAEDDLARCGTDVSAAYLSSLFSRTSQPNDPAPSLFWDCFPQHERG